MAMCEKFEKCPFYQGKMDCEKGIGAMYKKHYCEGDKAECARYVVSTKCGPQFVNNNLYPNMRDKANAILQENGLDPIL